MLWPTTNAGTLGQRARNSANAADMSPSAQVLIEASKPRKERGRESPMPR